MKKWISFILGVILLLLGLNSLIGFFNEPSYTFIIVGLIGVIILLTPSFGEGHTDITGFYYVVKRWVFGAFLILSAFGGLIPLVKNIIGIISYETKIGGIIILIIGLLYIITIFKRNEETDIKPW